MLPPDAVAMADQIEAHTLELLDAAIIGARSSEADFEGSVGLVRLGIITKEYLEADGGRRPPEVVVYDLLAEAIRRLASPPNMIRTAEELAAAPCGTVARSAVGTIARRHSSEWCAIFGDNRPYIWSDLALPAQVLWEPPPGGAG